MIWCPGCHGENTSFLPILVLPLKKPDKRIESDHIRCLRVIPIRHHLYAIARHLQRMDNVIRDTIKPYLAVFAHGYQAREVLAGKGERGQCIRRQGCQYRSAHGLPDLVPLPFEGWPKAELQQNSRAPKPGGTEHERTSCGETAPAAGYHAAKFYFFLKNTLTGTPVKSKCSRNLFSRKRV